MGTTSTKKFIKNAAGIRTEEAALTTSAGAGDADRIPALNASGVLDITIINGKVGSAGAGDSGKPVVRDAGGRIDITDMPVGIGADTATVLASEAIAAGDLVNIYNNGGTANMRKADGSTSGKEAHGFVLAAVSSAATGTVYFEGTNNQVTGLTPGRQFLSSTVPGKSTVTVPNAAGNITQIVGFATSATSMNFQSGDFTVLA